MHRPWCIPAVTCEPCPDPPLDGAFLMRLLPSCARGFTPAVFCFSSSSLIRWPQTDEKRQALVLFGSPIVWSGSAKIQLFICRRLLPAQFSGRASNQLLVPLWVSAPTSENIVLFQ